MRKISNRCDSGRDLSACVDTRKKIVAIQIALFSACGDTRKNSRDLNRDSNRAFLVCGNGPIIARQINTVVYGGFGLVSNMGIIAYENQGDKNMRL